MQEHRNAPRGIVNDSSVFLQVRQSLDSPTVRDSEKRADITCDEDMTIGRTSRRLYGAGAGETDRDLMLDTDEYVEAHALKVPTNRLADYRPLQLNQRNAVPGQVPGTT